MLPATSSHGGFENLVNQGRLLTDACKKGESTFHKKTKYFMIFLVEEDLWVQLAFMKTWQHMETQVKLFYCYNKAHELKCCSFLSPELRLQSRRVSSAVLGLGEGISPHQCVCWGKPRRGFLSSPSPAWEREETAIDFRSSSNTHSGSKVTCSVLYSWHRTLFFFSQGSYRSAAQNGPRPNELEMDQIKPSWSEREM